MDYLKLVKAMGLSLLCVSAFIFLIFVLIMAINLFGPLAIIIAFFVLAFVGYTYEFYKDMK